MFIQIFTKSILSKPNEYYLIHSHYLDCFQLDRKHLIYKADTQYIADLLNVGFAMKENIAQDRKIGIVHREFNFVSVYKGQKEAYTAKSWTEYAGGIRRNVTVYTENETLHKDLLTEFTQGDSLQTRLFNRVMKLRKDFSIGIGLEKESELTEERKDYWRKQYKI